MDIDFLVRKINMDRNTIIAAIKSLCSMPSNDNVEFRYVKDSEIRKEDIYGGFSITLEGRIENIHQQFNIDIATGDPIYPDEVDYQYKCVLTEEVLNIKSYSIESVISEKLQTILYRGILNSRSKDFMTYIF